MRLHAPSTLLGLLTLSLAACDIGGSDGGPRVESAAEAGELPADADDRFQIHTTDGSVKLGLTDEAVYMRLSDEVLQKAQAEMEGEGEEQGALAGMIRSAVSGAVSKALRTRVSFAHEDVRDIRWEGGELVVELENGERAFGDMRVDDDDVTEKFDEEDVEAFVEEWRKAKGDAAAGAGSPRGDASG